MQVTIRFKEYSAVAQRVLDSVLGSDSESGPGPETKTLHGLRFIFWYKTDVSPMVVLAAFQEGGIEFEDFESISFEP